MTTVRDIVRDAFRETNILPLGAEPNAAQSAEAVRLFNGLISSMYGNDVGEQLEDWPLGNFDRQSHPIVDFEQNIWFIQNPHINRRLLATNEEARTIHFSQRPQDGSRMAFVDPYSRASLVPVTLHGNGRPIEDQEFIVMDQDGVNRTWFYRGDLGKWVRLSALSLDDNSPFPEEFDTYMALALAMRINPRYGRNMDEQSIAMFQKTHRNFVNRYLQSLPMQQNPILSWPFMSVQTTDRYIGYANDFGTGRPGF